MMQFIKLQQALFLFLLGLVSIGFLWIIIGYVMPIFWALVFAIIFVPLYKDFLKYLKFQALSSALTIITILTLVFVPLFFIGGLVFNESQNIYQEIFSNSETGARVDLLNRLDTLVPYFEKVGISETELRTKTVALSGFATSWLTDQAVSLGGKTFSFVLKFFIMIYVLFFLLKDGDKIKKRFMEIMPLGDIREEKLFNKFTSTTRAGVKGTIIVGIIQGAVGGILFAIAGINGALLWGVVMTILSVVPAVGTVVVWLPAGIILIATGSMWEGVMILIGGALVISLIDNILRPTLVGKDIKMPDVLIFLSTLGGISVFGIAGFVMGPIIAGLFIAMWEMFEENYQKDLKLLG